MIAGQPHQPGDQRELDRDAAEGQHIRPCPYQHRDPTKRTKAQEAPERQPSPRTPSTQPDKSTKQNRDGPQLDEALPHDETSDKTIEERGDRYPPQERTCAASASGSPMIRSPSSAP